MLSINFKLASVVLQKRRKLAFSP